MKRTMAMMLALLLLFACAPASATVTQENPIAPYEFFPVVSGESYAWDSTYLYWDEHPLLLHIRDAMLAEGRAGYDLGLTACAVDPSDQFACVLVAGEDVLHMTILEKAADDAWRVFAWNDTIPAGKYSWQSLHWEQSMVFDGETGGILTLDTGRFRLSREQFVQNTTGREDQSTVILDFGRDASGVWRLYAIRNAFFAEAVNGRCPYLTLSWELDHWTLRSYEMIRVGYAWERSDLLGEWSVANDDLAGRVGVNEFDAPAFEEYLRSLQAMKASALSDTATPQPVQREEALLAAAKRLASGLNQQGTVYYNPQGSPYYHTSVVCEAEDVSAWPLSPIPIDRLNDPAYAHLSPCPRCHANSQLVYYNPEGGKYYHATATCSAVHEQYWPLTAIPAEQLNTPNFNRLLPCPKCDPPERPAVPEATETPETSEAPEFVYYNPNGGRYYHAVEDCPSVSPQYQPLAPIPFAQISDPEYARLVPCPRCNPAERSWPDD